MAVDKKDAYINEIERGEALDAFLQTLPENKRELIGHVVSALVRQVVDEDTAQSFRADDDYLHLIDCARATSRLYRTFNEELRFNAGRHLADSLEGAVQVSEGTKVAIRSRVVCALDAGMPAHGIRTRKTDGLGQGDVYGKLRNLAGLPLTMEDPEMAPYYPEERSSVQG